MLQQAAGDDAERDLYFDESSNTWDMSGLRSDLEVYGVTVGDAPPTTAPPPTMFAPAAPAVDSPEPSFEQMLSQASPLNAPAASAPAGPPPTMFAPAAPPVVPSPEPSFEQMLSSATPLNAPAAANGGPPSGRNSAPDSRDSWATLGAGRPSGAGVFSPTPPPTM